MSAYDFRYRNSIDRSDGVWIRRKTPNVNGIVNQQTVCAVGRDKNLGLSARGADLRCLVYLVVFKLQHRSVEVSLPQVFGIRTEHFRFCLNLTSTFDTACHKFCAIRFAA
jgi:hypothetical protein